MAAALDLPLSPVDSARAAGLRHVDPDAMAGYTRVRRGKGFVYFDASKRRVTDGETLARIAKLVIPPAWVDVWICPVANGHIQARGRDARGRKQYRYDTRWRETRDASKFHKMLAFAGALPRIRAACERDLSQRELSRDKVLATAVRLLELTHIRVGNEEYTRTNGSFGLTTLRNRHVKVQGAEIRFRFRGKSGKDREVDLHDKRLARIVAQCSDLPGQEVFQYVGDDGAPHGIDSSDVNDYIGRIAGEEFTAKDFRTWAGTVLAVRTLCELAACVTKSARTSAAKGTNSPAKATRGKVNANIVSCIKAVSSHLGNTPAVCKRSYVHPAVLDAYRMGTLADLARKGRSDESVVSAIIERSASMTEADTLTHALKASLHEVRSRGARSRKSAPRKAARRRKRAGR